MPTYQVHIKSNGRIADKHCRKTLRKSSGDRVRFMAVGEGNWTSIFRTEVRSQKPRLRVFPQALR
jgi:hypothetical protein